MRMRTLTMILFLAAATFYAGCASTSSAMMDAQRKEKPASGKAMVTFLRPGPLSAPYKFGIWDNEKFVGVLESSSYIQYETEPGEHMFLGRAENWAYVKANLEAGKEYFLRVKIFPGWSKMRIALDPIPPSHADSKQLDLWLNGNQPRQPNPQKAAEYVTAHRADAERGQNAFDPSKTKFFELAPGDGR